MAIQTHWYSSEQRLYNVRSFFLSSFPQGPHISTMVHSSCLLLFYFFRLTILHLVYNGLPFFTILLSYILYTGAFLFSLYYFFTSCIEGPSFCHYITFLHLVSRGLPFFAILLFYILYAEPFLFSLFYFFTSELTFIFNLYFNYI